ncbi:hypothetical protein ABZP36_012211 [Zizania latifolia]
MKEEHPQPVKSEPENKLQRLPSVFSMVLELPFPRGANVRTYFTPDADHYIVPRGVAGEPDVVKVRIVRLERWGITRVVVHIGPGEPNLEDDLVYDKWRFRLAETSIPSMTAAGFVNGQLIVIVPRTVVGGKKGILRWPSIGKRGGGGRGGCGLFGAASVIPTK